MKHILSLLLPAMLCMLLLGGLNVAAAKGSVPYGDAENTADIAEAGFYTNGEASIVSDPLDASGTNHVFRVNTTKQYTWFETYRGTAPIRLSADSAYTVTCSLRFDENATATESYVTIFLYSDEKYKKGENAYINLKNRHFSAENGKTDFTFTLLPGQFDEAVLWELGVRIDAQGVVAYIDNLCLFPVEATTSYFRLKRPFSPRRSPSM